MTSKKSVRPILSAKKRKVLGRKVKRLRKKGILPANIYGRKVKSLAVEINLEEAKKVFSQVGETGLVDLMVEKEKKPRPVLLHNPQKDPVSDKLIHLDLYQVDLTEKVTSDIPIETRGEAPAATKKEGVLVQLLSEIEVEALPTDLPEKFVVDVSHLEKVDDAITVGQMIKSAGIDPKKVAVKLPETQLVVKIELPTKEEEVAPPPTEETAVASEESTPVTEEKGEKETPQPESSQP